MRWSPLLLASSRPSRRPQWGSAASRAVQASGPEGKCPLELDTPKISPALRLSEVNHPGLSLRRHRACRALVKTDLRRCVFGGPRIQLPRSVESLPQRLRLIKGQFSISSDCTAWLILYDYYPSPATIRKRTPAPPSASISPLLQSKAQEAVASRMQTCQQQRPESASRIGNQPG